MSSQLQQVLADRATRDAARGALEGRLAQVKLDLEERGIGGRIADEVSDRAQIVMDEAVDVLEAHPGLIAGTIFAIVLWLFRNPIIALIGQLMEKAGIEPAE